MSFPNAASISWSAPFTLAPLPPRSLPPGDKILLPPSALEELLQAAARASEKLHSGSLTAQFDPWNSDVFSAERGARALAESNSVLPHPLTFRLSTSKGERVVYAGIREFSATEGQIVLSSHLRQALGIQSPSAKAVIGSGQNKVLSQHVESVDQAQADSLVVMVRYTAIPKGTFVRLRPLEAGYDPADWKPVLQQMLYSNFTTLTDRETIVALGDRQADGTREEFTFLIDGLEPNGPAICVVDTDLAVDIEALDESQARETLRRIAAKSHKTPGLPNGSSAGGELNLFRGQDGQVLNDEYVDYEIPSWDRTQGLAIEVSTQETDKEIDLFASPFSSRHRNRPRLAHHLWADWSSTYPRRICVMPGAELEGAESIRVSIRATSGRTNEPFTRYHIRASACESTPGVAISRDTDTPPQPGDVYCTNCERWVPGGNFGIHRDFCLTNNHRCQKGCGQVFHRRSPEFKNHWHCPHDEAWGNTPLYRDKHQAAFHGKHSCESCGSSRIFKTIPQLAEHRTTSCPAKLILCRFCHLQVPQGGNSDEELSPALAMLGLSPHEAEDGARTVACHVCGLLVQLLNMSNHMRNHELERRERPPPLLCRNIYCGRTLSGTAPTGNTRADTSGGRGRVIGLCSTCYGPLHTEQHDPEGKALRRRVERRYFSQLLAGCEQPWCRNLYCRTGRKNAGGVDKAVQIKEAAPLVRPLLDDLKGTTLTKPLHFCVGETSHQWRAMAELLSAEPGPEDRGGYTLEWCIGAIEAESGDLDNAREWLAKWAPQRREG